MDAGGSRLSAEELDQQEAEDLAAAISASLADLSLGHGGAEEGSGPDLPLTHFIWVPTHTSILLTPTQTMREYPPSPSPS